MSRISIFKKEEKKKENLKKGKVNNNNGLPKVFNRDHMP